MSAAMPIRVRLDVEGMRHSILHAFEAHNDELEVAVNDAVSRATNGFDVGHLATVIAEEMLPRMLREAVEDALRKAFASPEFRDALDLKVGEALIGWAMPAAKDTPA